MKKITLALCACAFALTGLLASCSNEATSVNYKNVGSYDSSYAYAAKGTIKNTVSSSETSSSGVFTSSRVTETKIEDADYTVYWTTGENLESNNKWFNISGSYFGTTTTTSSAALAGNSLGSSKEISSGKTSFNKYFVCIDDVYYMKRNGELVALDEFAIDEEDVIDGDFDGEFTITYKLTEDMTTFENYCKTHGYTNVTYNKELNETNCTEYAEWKAWKESAKPTFTNVEEVKITFFPLQDFDPEAELEEDDE